MIPVLSFVSCVMFLCRIKHSATCCYLAALLSKPALMVLGSVKIAGYPQNHWRMVDGLQPEIRQNQRGFRSLKFRSISSMLSCSRYCDLRHLLILSICQTLTSSLNVPGFFVALVVIFKHRFTFLLPKVNATGQSSSGKMKSVPIEAQTGL